MKSALLPYWGKQKNLHISECWGLNIFSFLKSRRKKQQHMKASKREDPFPRCPRESHQDYLRLSNSSSPPASSAATEQEGTSAPLINSPGMEGEPRWGWGLRWPPLLHNIYSCCFFPGRERNKADCDSLWQSEWWWLSCQRQTWPLAPASHVCLIKILSGKQLGQLPVCTRHSHSVGESCLATGERGGWEQSGGLND